MENSRSSGEKKQNIKIFHLILYEFGSQYCFKFPLIKKINLNMIIFRNLKITNSSIKCYMSIHT